MISKAIRAAVLSLTALAIPGGGIGCSAACGGYFFPGSGTFQQFDFV